ncbi:Maf family protein [Dyadobacter tibetensis]|uniref:Maf family protein n=1 Tax=Dyadobacter tibetensis TaxID=1211851 RepID=UPI001E54F71B|nr:Maf family protein [Dyadobacter tibetensis]
MLASNSPRRKELLSQLGYNFESCPTDTDESYPFDLEPQKVAAFICRKKAEAIRGKYPQSIAITADTVVVRGETILGKPVSLDEAKNILRSLSGQKHQVVTAFCLVEDQKINTFEDIATVWFREIDDSEIDFYLTHGSPMDKAGAYGIQEWIGLIAIEKIEGSYFTIMGLPTHQLFQALQPFSFQETQSFNSTI